MSAKAIIVIDVGKTLSKASLWTADGVLLDRQTRANNRLEFGPYLALDADGIEAWLTKILATFATMATIGGIIPIAHGAAAVLIRNGKRACPPLDYEAHIPPESRARYEACRPPFAETGAPALPDGLNLGAQLHWLEQHLPEAVVGAQIVPWAQYWAWLFSGVAATEVTSLGCHTDLWDPVRGRPSSLAMDRGWAAAFPPLRRAGDRLGPISPAWAARTGLPKDTPVYCGLHDSNAALVAARGCAEVADCAVTILSTGTWFVAMRTMGSAAAPTIDLKALPEARDCLVNVDADGRPTPSARWMGGREIELLTGAGMRIDDPAAQPEMCAAAADVIRDGVMVLPGFVKGCGPFGGLDGGWINEPTSAAHRAAAIALYAALVTHESLGLIGAHGHILVEGRFAEAAVFTRALAALRPRDAIYKSSGEHDASFGALRLVNPALRTRATLGTVEALAGDLLPYTQLWRQTVAQREASA